MGKSQTNQSDTQAQQTYNQSNGMYDQMMSYLQGQLPGQTAVGQQEQSTNQNYLEGAMNSGMGAYNPQAYNALTGQINQNIATGGYNNQQQLTQLNNDIAGDVSSGGYNQGQVQAMEAGGMGGMDPTQLANVQSGYNNLISTGGISDQTEQAMERQAQSGVQANYATAGQNLNRESAAQGISAGGETAEMARQMGQQEANAVTGVQSQVGQLRQQGTEAGLTGLGGLTAQGAQLQQNLMGSVAANREAGVNQEAGLAANQAQNALNSTNELGNIDTSAATQALQSSQGLTSLYASQPGYLTSLVGQIMQQQQTTGTIDNESSQILAELSKNPGLFQNIMSGLGAVGGLASGIGGMVG
jgi:hypothetical protein